MAQRTVLIRSTPEGPIQKEMIMDAAVRPGMLVELASSTRIQVLSATIDPTMRVVVECMDTEISATYASGETIPYIVPRRGDEVYAYATSSALATLAVTNKLVSDGNGFLTLFDTTATQAAGEVIAEVVEATATIAAGVVSQVHVEVL